MSEVLIERDGWTTTFSTEPDLEMPHWQALQKMPENYLEEVQKLVELHDRVVWILNAINDIARTDRVNRSYKKVYRHVVRVASSLLQATLDAYKEMDEMKNNLDILKEALHEEAKDGKETVQHESVE